MVRQEQVRRSAGSGPDAAEPEPWLDRLPRRPLADTRSASRLLERIRRLLVESRSTR